MASIKSEPQKRREALMEILRVEKKPLIGAALAKRLGVSRQVIVGDIGILRAQGIGIYATLRGYKLAAEADAGLLATIFCRHDRVGLEKELFTILEYGGKIRDVVIEHPLYGEIRAELMIESDQQAKEFLRRFDDLKAVQLSTAAGGFHYHTIEVLNQEALWRIQKALREHKIMTEEEF